MIKKLLIAIAAASLLGATGCAKDEVKDKEPFGYWKTDPSVRLKSGDMAYGVSTQVEGKLAGITCADGEALVFVINIETDLTPSSSSSHRLVMSYDGEKSPVFAERSDPGRYQLPMSEIARLSGIRRWIISYEGNKIASFDMRTFDREFDKVRQHCGM